MIFGDSKSKRLHLDLPKKGARGFVPKSAYLRIQKVLHRLVQLKPAAQHKLP